MDPNLNAALGQVRVILLIVAGILADEGFGHTGLYKIILVAAGSVVALGSALWAFYNSLVNFRKARAVGVQAALNMVQAGKAIDVNGQVVSKIGAGTTPFKEATVKSSEEIIANFGPKPSDIAKS